MSLLDSMDLYCERLGPGLLAEPLNAVSNASFFLAAWLALRAVRRARARGVVLPGGLPVLPWLMFGIATASLCFHTTGQVWAMLLDSGFIALYLCAFSALWARHVLALPWRRAWLGAPLFAGFTAAVTAVLSLLRLSWLPPDVTLYVAAWIVMGGMTVATFAREHAGARWLVGTLLLFTASLTARQADLPLCEVWPWGTHWAWHLLNGGVLALSFRALAQGPAAHRPSLGQSPA